MTANRIATHSVRRLSIAALCLLAAGLPSLALAGSPFETGANAFQISLLGILTPFAVIGLMASGGLASAGRISWMWFAGCVVGIVLIFGAPQVVTWVRTMFAV